MAAPPSKKSRSEDQEIDKVSLDGFQTKNILMNDVKAKKVHVLGKIICKSG